jgi:integrase
LLCIFNRLSSISRVYGNPYVFPGTKKGLPIAPPRLAFNLIKERSGIPRPHGVVLHIARHSVTSKLISHDVDISSVQKLLNHKSDATVFKTQSKCRRVFTLALLAWDLNPVILVSR